MYVYSFIGARANPANTSEVANLQQAQRDYKKIIDEMTQRIAKGETLQFADFINEMAEKLQLIRGFVENVMWHVLTCNYITLNSAFEISLHCAVKVPDICEVDPTDGLVEASSFT